MTPATLHRSWRRKHQQWPEGLPLIAIALCLLVSCTPDVPTETSTLPDLVGKWEYTAYDLIAVGSPPAGKCKIEGMSLLLGPWRYTGLFGRTQGGRISCVDGLEFLDADLPSYPVRNGGSVLNFIAFDIGSPNWRHDGTISGDTMSGVFWIQHPNTRLEGRFRAVLVQRGPAETYLSSMAKEGDRDW